MSSILFYWLLRCPSLDQNAELTMNRQTDRGTGWHTANLGVMTCSRLVYQVFPNLRNTSANEHTQIVQEFNKKVSLYKTVNNLRISSSTVDIIIKRFRDSRASSALWDPYKAQHGKNTLSCVLWVDWSKLEAPFSPSIIISCWQLLKSFKEDVRWH